MAERPIWRGHLRLALVSCPIALYPAHRESGNLHFHFINPATGNRVRTVTLDGETGAELSRRDLARGYEFEKDRYVLLDEDDFEQARIDSSSTLTVDKFVPVDSIDPVYIDTSYFLAPDGEAGQDVYVVLRDAIAQAKRAALSRLVMSRRERAVAILPMGRGLVLHTLYERRDIADPAAHFAAVPAAKPDPEMVKLATQLIDRQSAQFDPDDMEDRYESRLRAVIDAKISGASPTPPPGQAPERGNVVDLMAALKRSLGQNARAPGKAAAKPPSSKAVKAKTKPAGKPAPRKPPSRKRA
jgi:DNA end-binding protein Ku